jgi:hypothetical protein
MLQCLLQAIKNNAEAVPALILLQQNYMGNAGRTALKEALEDAYDMFQVELTIKM